MAREERDVTHCEPAPRPRRRRRWLWRGLGGVLGVLVVLGGWVMFDVWEALGSSVERGSAREARMAASPSYADGAFANALKVEDPKIWPALKGMLFDKSAHASPAQAPPIVERRASDFEAAPSTGLRVTWLGHSTTLLEVDGARVLTDPVWSKRSAPSQHWGPARFHAPPLPLEELPPVDAVVISHDHYDHLDMGTVKRLVPRDLPWFVPLGVGAHLEGWGVPASRITELDWWERAEVPGHPGVELVATPSRHFSGRKLIDRNATLWSGWAVVGPQHRVYFSGDTGMFPGFADIGERLGPFDVTMIESGAYNQLWADVHLGPEQAVEAHRMARGKVFMPVHWGTFDLALHGWTEPVERVLEAARTRQVAVAVPRIGASFEPGAMGAAEADGVARWWPEEPWQTAQEAPVVSSKMEGFAYPPVADAADAPAGAPPLKAVTP